MTTTVASVDTEVSMKREWMRGRRGTTTLSALVVIGGVCVAVVLFLSGGASRSQKAIADTISPAVTSAISDQSIALVPAPAGTSPTVSGASAIAANAQSSANVVAEQLVQMTAPMTGGQPMLVWAIQESLPAGSGAVKSEVLSPLGSPPMTATGQYNYRIDFVDAATNRLIVATEGNAAGLSSP